MLLNPTNKPTKPIRIGVNIFYYPFTNNFVIADDVVSAKLFM